MNPPDKPTLETELAATERLRFAADADRRRLRAELAVAENWVEHHSKHADDLIAENVKLRADLERFTGHGLLDCHAICDQRDAAIARAERAEAALADWSLLNTWGGTPEIIHEFIKGQQHRIHYCQDLEADCVKWQRLLLMSRDDREANLLSALKLMVSKFDAFIDSEYCGTDLLAEQLAQADFAREVIREAEGAPFGT